MINMIRMEFFKLKKRKIFYVILLFIGAISIMSSFSAMELDTNLNGRTQFVEMFHDASMLFACAIFVAIYVGDDFNNRTIQSQVASGHPKDNILVAKLVGFMIAAQMIMMLYPAIGAITVTIRQGWGAEFSYQETIYVILTFIEGFILNIGTSSYFVMFAFICRDFVKTLCLSAAFPIIFSIVKPFISQVPIIRYLINLMSISQINNIGIVNMEQFGIILLSALLTLLINIFIMRTVFYKVEMK